MAETLARRRRLIASAACPNASKLVETVRSCVVIKIFQILDSRKLGSLTGRGAVGTQPGLLPVGLVGRPPEVTFLRQLARPQPPFATPPTHSLPCQTR